jgi:uncharacterized protein (DUF302 family)
VARAGISGPSSSPAFSSKNNERTFNLEVSMTLRNARRHLTGPATLLFALTAAFSTAALGSDDDKGGVGFSLTPFSRVAFDVVDTTDPTKTPYDVAKAAATAIATYVATVDDAPDFGSDWVLGGLEGDPTEAAIEEAILRVPTPYLIDPDEPMSAANRKKVNIVEMCNKTFAQKALGLLAVVEGDDTTKIIDGYIHAPALPCEVAIYADEDGLVKVDMLQPEAIFTLFFTDVLFGEQMLDPAFAAAIQELPAEVNAQIRTIIQTALDGAGFAYVPQSKPLGPTYNSLEEVAEVVDETPYDSPYVHFAYQKLDGTLFTDSDAATIAAAIIETMSLDGVHDPELDDLLNIDDWRSARPAPLPVPGNRVIEACSPTNAIAAMGLGMDHATALPCEIAIKPVSLDGIDGNESLMVTYLDPHFMFSALFSDAFDDLTEEELDAFMALPPEVLEDLQTIVAYAFEKNLAIALTEPEQVEFDMLPEDEEEDDHYRDRHGKGGHYGDDGDHHQHKRDKKRGAKD